MFFLVIDVGTESVSDGCFHLVKLNQLLDCQSGVWHVVFFSPEFDTG